MTLRFLCLMTGALLMLNTMRVRASPDVLRASPEGGTHVINVHRDVVTVIALPDRVRAALGSAPKAHTIGFNKDFKNWVIVRPKAKTRGRSTLLIMTETTAVSVVLNVTRSPKDAVTWYPIQQKKTAVDTPGGTFVAPPWKYRQTLTPRGEIR